MHNTKDVFYSQADMRNTLCLIEERGIEKKEYRAHGCWR